MNAEQRIRLIARAIDGLCPLGHSIEVNVRRYSNDVCVVFHGVKSYEEATEVCRAMGVQKRDKTPYADEPNPRTVLQGDIAPGIRLQVFCQGLPPSCRVEKYVEKVPKTQTVEIGEFIEIERVKIVCGEQPQQPAPIELPQEATA